MTAWLALLAAVLVSIPHAINQSGLPSTTGACLWLAVLALRAVFAVAVVLMVVLLVPSTGLFTFVTHWCLHAILPFSESHLGFDGHRLGGMALLFPAALLGVSAVAALFATWRGARLVSNWVRQSSLGPGPQSSLLVGGSEVIVACAGVRQPKVVVSAGALAVLDDAELSASLQHERGHAVRRHGLARVFGQLCLGASRLLPGGRRALATLLFHLERNADEYAVRETGNPLALASAICKAAASTTPAMSLPLSGSGVSERLSMLVDGRPTGRTSRRWPRGLGIALTAAAVSMAMTLAISIPALGSSGFQELRANAEAPTADCA